MTATKAPADTNTHRLQALFEGCALACLKNTAITGKRLSFEKFKDGTYVSPATEDLYTLWLHGHGQGVVDHAHAHGDINL